MHDPVHQQIFLRCKENLTVAQMAMAERQETVSESYRLRRQAFLLRQQSQHLRAERRTARRDASLPPPAKTPGQTPPRAVEDAHIGDYTQFLIRHMEQLMAGIRQLTES